LIEEVATTASSLVFEKDEEEEEVDDSSFITVVVIAEGTGWLDPTLTISPFFSSKTMLSKLSILDNKCSLLNDAKSDLNNNNARSQRCSKPDFSAGSTCVGGGGGRVCARSDWVAEDDCLRDKGGGAIDGGAVDGGAVDGGAEDDGAEDGGAEDGGAEGGGAEGGGAEGGGAEDEWLEEPRFGSTEDEREWFLLGGSGANGLFVPATLLRE
jgi:hypothetical protein